MAVRPPSPVDNEPAPTGRKSRTQVMVMGAVAAVVLAMGLTGGHDTSSDTASSDVSRPPRAAQPSTSAPPAGKPAGQSARQPAGQSAGRPAAQSAGRYLPRSRPVRLVIPKIWVDAPFTDLAIGPKGQLEPPPAADTNLVGWYAKGASPGEAGTSIIAGHVDTTTSAAVFANLGELKKGDAFHVERADGRKASFVVDSVETFDKEHFPSRRVYGDTAQAQVRLITCAGDYNRTVRDYTDNLVVFAHLA